jgi:hypothetical protein
VPLGADHPDAQKLFAKMVKEEVKFAPFIRDFRVSSMLFVFALVDMQNWMTKTFMCQTRRRLGFSSVHCEHPCTAIMENYPGCPVSGRSSVQRVWILSSIVFHILKDLPDASIRRQVASGFSSPPRT